MDIGDSVRIHPEFLEDSLRKEYWQQFGKGKIVDKDFTISNVPGFRVEFPDLGKSYWFNPDNLLKEE